MAGGGYRRGDPATIVCMTASGRFKVYWTWATSPMAWVGDNSRFAPVAGQPHRGWVRYRDASAFESSVPPDSWRSSRLNFEGGSYIPTLRQPSFCIDRNCALAQGRPQSPGAMHVTWEHPEFNDPGRLD